MFFTGELPVRVDNRGNAFLASDAITRLAESSGVPFYLPDGARERLGVRPVSNPNDTKGYDITYTVKLTDRQKAQVISEFTVRGPSGTRTFTLDKSKNAPRALDPAVTGIPVTAVPTTEKTPAPSPSSTTKSTQTTPTKTTPTKTSPTTSTASNVPAPSGGESSSAGIVIGVLLALVAVVGAAVVAMPMVTG